MTYEQWVEQYVPIQNAIGTSGAYDGTMWETSGKEEQFVRNSNPQHVWTLMTDDDGRLIITSGWAFVNRMGYFLTRYPWDGERGDIIIDAE